MQRLTHKDSNGKWCLKGVPWEKLHAGECITDEIRERLYGALFKLMRYEDTGLAPDEIVDLNNFKKSQTAHLLKELGKERKKHEWIPVDERIPENPDQMVLVQISGRPACNIGLENALCIAQYYPDEGWILEEYPFWEDAHPVAWMPLPDLYRD